MCAINPKYKKRYIIDVYTSDSKMTKEEFDYESRVALFQMEVELNTKYSRFRFHLKESENIEPL